VTGPCGQVDAYGRLMPLARRQLLGIGAAVGISLATSACRDQRQDPTLASERPTALPPSSVPAASPATGPSRPAVPAFAGQPPPGHVYYGASLPAHRSISAWETRLGSTVALHRSYFTPDANETAQLVRQCRDDLAHDRLPHVSMKPPGTWQDVASGRYDAWLGSLLQQLGQAHAPIFLTVHHEPENDAGAPGMGPADYVAMQRRAIRLAAEVAPEVTIVPILQHWSFEPLRPGIDPTAWIVDEAVVHGVDVYNAWSPTNGKPWRSLGSRVDEVFAWLGDVPLAIGEYGCREDPRNPGLAAEWLRDAAEYARSHSVVSMSYFNSDVHSPDGSLELSGETEETFAELLASDWVARPR
jgi:hypothetical protein